MYNRIGLLGESADGTSLIPKSKQDTNPYSFSQAVGWTVVWNNVCENWHKMTVWTGQYQLNSETGEEQIYAFWLLVTETETVDDWEATQIGQDTFTRNPPDEDMINRARRREGRPMPN